MKSILVQNIIDCMSIGLIVINPVGDIVSANSAASKILGVTADDMRAKGWMKLFYQEKENARFNDILIDVFTNRRVDYHIDVPYRRADGAGLTLSLTSSYLTEGDEFAGIVMLIDDISDMHRMLENRSRMLEERSHLQHERAESLRLFARSVAHQIRNPLTTIGGFTRRIAKSRDESVLKQYTGVILQEVSRLEKLVEHVEKFTTVSNLSFATVNLGRIIEEARKKTDILALDSEKNIHWHIDLAATSIIADEEWLAWAINECTRNALESFADGKGTIEVHSRQDIETVTLTIRDDGRGIAPKDMPYIFDPFYTTSVQSIGMGLATVRRIVEEHHGDITVDSITGRGTIVTITLPASVETGRAPVQSGKIRKNRI